MNKSDLVEKLRRMDEDAFFALGPTDATNMATVVIVGGSALLLQDLSAKPVTKDVDIYQVESRVREILFSDPDFNSHCAAFTQNLPYDYEDRLVRVLPDTRVIAFYTPSSEDLAVMKLYRWEDPDKADLCSPEFLKQLDWELLEQLVMDPEKAAASRSALPEKDRELQEMRRHFKEYREGWGL